MQFLPIKQFQSIHDNEQEISSMIQQRMKKQREAKELQLQKSKNVVEGTVYPIEHSFVDLNWLIIGEKMHAIKDDQKLNNMRFDHLFYANMILKQYNEMNVFAQKTI